MPVPVQELIAAAKSECHCLDARAARELYDVSEGAIIIDVREPREAGQSRLEQSINIPRGLLEMKITDACPDEGQAIFVHCGGGGRASLSAKTLQDIGYTNVHVLKAKFDEILEVFS